MISLIKNSKAGLNSSLVLDHNDMQGLDKNEILKYLDKSDRVEVINADEKLDMGEKDPIGEIRRNREPSLVKSFEAV